MMRALPLLLVLSACAASQPDEDYGLLQRPIAAARFDAPGWLERARAADVRMAEDDAVTDATMTRLAAEKQLTATLDAAVGWARACDTYWDAAENREVTQAMEPGGGHFLRGTYSLYDIGPGEAVAAIVCDFGAYQGSYALVHLDGARADLLRAAYIDLDGSVSGPPSAVFATPAFDTGARTFETLALSRGLGDCGLLQRYTVGSGGEARLLQARSRDCDDRATEAPPPQEWPVVFPRP